MSVFSQNVCMISLRQWKYNESEIDRIEELIGFEIYRKCEIKCVWPILVRGFERISKRCGLSIICCYSRSSSSSSCFLCGRIHNTTEKY